MMMTAVVTAVVCVLLLAAACSSAESADDAVPAPTAAPTAVSTAVPTRALATATAVATADPVSEVQTSEPLVPSEPFAEAPPDAEVRVQVRPADNPGGENELDHWITRNEMTESRVELVWADVAREAPDVEISYQVFRVLTRQTADLLTVPLTGDNVVYIGPETTFVDEDVTADTYYSYLLVPVIDGEPSHRRWTSALTTTDTEPPASIEGLTGDRTADGILLCWEPTTDNVEFASYAVVLVAADGTGQYLGGGADLGQTCFLDDRPPVGAATYEVSASDFHENRSDVVNITVP